MRRAATTLLCIALMFTATAASTPGVSTSRGTVPGIQTIYVVHTSHWDYGFTDPPANLPALIKLHIDDMVAKVQSDPRHRYTIESVWVLEDYISVATPQQVETLMGLIRAGRIALSSAYTGPHSGIMSAEELNRWIYRARKLRDQYSIPSRAAIVDDNPGYSWALPDALAGSGVDRLVCGPNTAFANEFPLPRSESIFRWRGPGGGETLTWVSRDAYTEGFGTWQIDANAARLFYGADHPEWAGWTNQQIMAQGIAAQTAVLESNGYPYDAALAILAFDKMNYDPSGALLGDILTWNATHVSPQIKLATPDEFFDHVVTTYGLGAFPVRSGNWAQRWERTKAYGMICQARFREIRDGLSAVESLGTVGSQFGAPYPATVVDSAYRDLMRYDDHGGGVGGTQPLEMTLAECNATNLYWMQLSLAHRDAVRGAVDNAATSIAARLATGPNPEIVVFNSLSSPRTDLAVATAPAAQPFALRDAVTGAAVPYQVRPDSSIEFVAENVPALGLRRYRVLAGQSDGSPTLVSTTTGGPTATVESAHYRVVLNTTTGEITSMVDKAAGNRELVNAASTLDFNRTVKARNTADFLGGNPTRLNTSTATVTGASGTVSGALTVSYAPPPGANLSSPISKFEVRLFDRLHRIDVVNTYDRSRLTYTLSTDDHSEHFYAPMPFAIPVANLQTYIDGNAASPLRPPTATYLTGPTVTAVNNSNTPSRGVTLRDAVAGFEISVVSPEVFWYVVGNNLNSYVYNPAEATLLGQTMAKQDRTKTDDPGFPELNFVLEPLESAPTVNYSVYTSRFSITSGPVRTASATGDFGSGVMTPLETAIVPGGQSGPIAASSVSFFSVAAPNVEILTVKHPDFGDPADVIVRVRERDGLATSSVLRSSFVVVSASEATLLETPTMALPLPVPVNLLPWQTKTLRLRLGAFAPAGADTAGVYLPSVGAWFLRNSNTPGAADVTASYGPGGLIPVAGDWNGDGADTLGVFDPSTSTFFLKNTNAPGGADIVASFGPPGSGWTPIVGDWNGDGVDTVGLYDAASGAFFLRNANAPGAADLVFTYGPAGAVPLAGDWNGDGIDTVGIYITGTGTFFLRNTNAPGGADLAFTFGAGGGIPLAGDWNGDGVDTIGLSLPATGTFFLRNSNAGGGADLAFNYGPPGAMPVMGDWDGN